MTGGRIPQAAHGGPSAHAPHAALLVDFDNVTMGIRSDLQNQLRKLLNSDIIKGKVSVQRAYADWRRYPQYIVPLSEASIDLIFAPAVGANKKNATDIRLAIDALELVFTRPEIGTYILLSGDSDFSALVLKLKEYGKYVIGVGIRESSSDLLVQNCDEYFSYNELTGLAKEGAVEHVRRDPWQLAVEAVQKMHRDGDVMRSDRLKQVMQGIDPDFDEKNAGFNRFSKFVTEAAKRGLLRLVKMENGQYSVELGSNANVPIDLSVGAQAPAAETEAVTPRSRRGRSGREAAGREPKPRHLTLSESFDLLKRALLAIGAVGTEATVAANARDQMSSLAGGDADPVFESKRFVRLLRQAHDAGLIELIKSDGDEYMLKLSAAGAVGEHPAQATEPAAGPLVMTGAEVVEPGLPPATKATETDGTTAMPERPARREATRVRKSSRSRARASAKDTADSAEVPVGEHAMAPPGAPAEEDGAKPKRSSRGTAPKARASARRGARAKIEKSAEALPGDTVAVEPAVTSSAAGAPPARSHGISAGRNPRFRTGSRGMRVAAPTPAEPPRATMTETKPIAPRIAVQSPPRSLGMRSGSRNARHAEHAAAPQRREEGVRVVTPAAPEQHAPKRELEAPAVPLAPPEEVPHEEALEAGGLLRRMTAALQRAMGVKDQTGE